MKKYILLLSVFPFLMFSQSKDFRIKKGKETAETQVKEIADFRKKLNKEYKNPKETPLRGNHFSHFKQHPFFPVNLKYRVTAKLIRTENPLPFDWPASSGKSKPYQEFGKAVFELEGKSHALTVYQSLDLMKTDPYKDYLFLPFRDETNGNETYGGGRYMDLKIPEGDTLVLDFNQSYQPYCAYNAYDYSCPTVPENNRLTVAVKAGVMYENIYHQ